MNRKKGGLRKKNVNMDKKKAMHRKEKEKMNMNMKGLRRKEGEH
jgi:hypothetical protein